MGGATTIYPSLQGIDLSTPVPMSDVGELLLRFHAVEQEVPECVDLEDVVEIAASSGVDEDVVERTVRAYLSDSAARLSGTVASKASELEDLLLRTYSRFDEDGSEAVYVHKIEKDEDTVKDQEVRYSIVRYGDTLEVHARGVFQGLFYNYSTESNYWAWRDQRLFDCYVRPSKKKPSYDIRFKVRGAGRGDSRWFIMWLASADDSQDYNQRLSAYAARMLKDALTASTRDVKREIEGFDFQLER